MSKMTTDEMAFGLHKLYETGHPISHELYVNVWERIHQADEMEAREGPCQRSLIEQAKEIVALKSILQKLREWLKGRLEIVEGEDPRWADYVLETILELEEESFPPDLGRTSRSVQRS